MSYLNIKDSEYQLAICGLTKEKKIVKNSINIFDEEKNEEPSLIFWDIECTKLQLLSHLCGLIACESCNLTVAGHCEKSGRIWLDKKSHLVNVVSQLGRRVEKKKPKREYIFIREFYKILKLEDFFKLHINKFDPTNKEKFYHKSIKDIGLLKEWKEFITSRVYEFTGQKIDNIAYNLGSNGYSLNPNYDKLIEKVRNQKPFGKKDYCVSLSNEIKSLVAIAQGWTPALLKDKTHNDNVDKYSYALHCKLKKYVPVNIFEQTSHRLSENEKNDIQTLGIYLPQYEHLFDKKCGLHCFNMTFIENLWITSELINKKLPRWNNKNSGFEKCKYIAENILDINTVDIKLDLIKSKLYQQHEETNISEKNRKRQQKTVLDQLDEVIKMFRHHYKKEKNNKKDLQDSIL